MSQHDDTLLSTHLDTQQEDVAPGPTASNVTPENVTGAAAPFETEPSVLLNPPPIATYYEDDMCEESEEEENVELGEENPDFEPYLTEEGQLYGLGEEAAARPLRTRMYTQKGHDYEITRRTQRFEQERSRLAQTIAAITQGLEAETLNLEDLQAAKVSVSSQLRTVSIAGEAVRLLEVNEAVAEKLENLKNQACLVISQIVTVDSILRPPVEHRDKPNLYRKAASTGGCSIASNASTASLVKRARASAHSVELQLHAQQEDRARQAHIDAAQQEEQLQELVRQEQERQGKAARKQQREKEEAEAVRREASKKQQRDEEVAEAVRREASKKQQRDEEDAEAVRREASKKQQRDEEDAEAVRREASNKQQREEQEAARIFEGRKQRIMEKLESAKRIDKMKSDMEVQKLLNYKAQQEAFADALEKEASVHSHSASPASSIDDLLGLEDPRQLTPWMDLGQSLNLDGGTVLSSQQVKREFQPDSHRQSLQPPQSRKVTSTVYKQRKDAKQNLGNKSLDFAAANQHSLWAHNNKSIKREDPKKGAIVYTRPENALLRTSDAATSNPGSTNTAAPGFQARRPKASCPSTEDYIRSLGAGSSTTVYGAANRPQFQRDTSHTVYFRTPELNLQNREYGSAHHQAASSNLRPEAKSYVPPSYQQKTTERNPAILERLSDNSYGAEQQETNATQEFSPSSHSQTTPSGTAIDSHLQNMAQTLANALTLSRLPIQEPCVFSGDPLEYPTWKSAFEFLIQRQDIPCSEKLLYLKRFVSGGAAEAIKGFFYMRDEGAYASALAILEKRYGSSFVISQAFRNKLDDWELIKNKDCVALRSFSDFLHQCVVAAQEVGGLGILDDIQYLRKLMAKLPDWMGNRWTRKVSHCKDSKGRYPTFIEFATFVSQEADIINDPIFGTASSTTTAATKGPNQARVSQQRPTGNTNRLSLSTTTLVEETTCAFCERKYHDITACHQFLKKTVEERSQFIANKGLCYGCLKSTQHRSRECKNRLTCATCQGRHATLLHQKNFSRNATGSQRSGGASTSSTPASTNSTPEGQASNDKPTEPPKSSPEIKAANSRRTQSGNGGNFTSTIFPVYLSSAKDPTKEILVYAMVDSMSNATFIVESCADAIDAPSQRTSLKLTTLSERNTLVPCKMYQGLMIRAMDSEEYVHLPPSYSRKYLSVDSADIPTRETAANHSHLRHLCNSMQPLMPECPVGLLIGYDCPEVFSPLEHVQGLPFAIRTSLGWCVIGSTSSHPAFDAIGSSHRIVVQQADTAVSQAVHVFKTEVKEATCNDLLHVLERDFIDTETGSMSQDDVCFLRILEENTSKNQAGHYEMPLPFRNENPTMSDNRGAAMKRTLGLKRQFERKPEYQRDYVKFMSEILNRGDAEQVPEEELEKSSRWYIPHHGVYHPKKPGKIRVVFDCSARHQGSCLNDELLQGPDQINSLIGVLCRFRKGPIAFSCDIEKMFHQFHVSPPHRDYLRFMWWEDGDTAKPLRDYRMKVHIFGATSSPGCANYGLKQVAKDHALISEDASKFLQHDFYVDDGLQAKNTVDEAAEILTRAREICTHGNIRLHKITSNSPELLSRFPSTEVATTKITSLSTPLTESAAQRTLGLQWFVDTDEFGFTSEPKSGPTTRREILSTIASLYDPLGFLAPFILKGKLILQEMCCDGLDWDDALPKKLEEAWNLWLSDLVLLPTIRIPRNILPSQSGSPRRVEIHHFSDASEIGYGQCSYLRIQDSDESCHCSLVMAKSRVAPTSRHRKPTLPRLELQAAVLSAKMASFLQQELHYENVEHFFWTDSEIVLAYLNNKSRRFHVFVANRIQQILQHSKASQWRHVATDLNPADHASRGLTVDKLRSSSWFHGPAFLREPLTTTSEMHFEIADNDPEVKSARATRSEEQTFTSWEDRVSRFSKKEALIRGVALLIRHCAERNKNAASNTKKMTTLESFQLAETRLTALIQQEHFTRPSKAVLNTLKQLDCSKDSDGVLRVGGRLDKSKDTAKCDHPVVLPHQSHFAVLVARYAHEKIAHQGRSFTISQMRSYGYWVLGIRRVVTSIIQHCTTCTRLRGRPKGQKMAELPSERVNESAPFSYCGLDCFGPFHVKDGRREMKRYGLIVTCLSSRAVHIEVLEDMSTDSFINALRIVIAFRGNIRLIRCDRGTNFVGAENEFKAAWKQLDENLIISKLLAQNCEFLFNPPSASHMGGVWERQIRTIRSVLNGLLKNQGLRLTTATLRSFLYEAMAIINSRPLCVEDLESADGPRPLTPNHILTMKQDGILPAPGVFEDADIYVKKRWRCVQRLANEFWHKWRRGYLASLQIRRKWQQPVANLQVDDIVMLNDENAPRASWRLARITEVFTSDDGLVRSVKVLLPSPLDKHGRPSAPASQLTRPVHKMVVWLRKESSN